jgi:predicted esterase
MSNGGITAFYVAAAYPKYFLSITGFPGYLPDATPERMNALAKMCIHMHAGELDTGWVARMKDQTAALQSKGIAAHFSVEKGESHVIGALTGPGSARLFDEIEETGRGCSK